MMQRARGQIFRSNEINSQRVGPWHSKSFILRQFEVIWSMQRSLTVKYADVPNQLLCKWLSVILLKCFPAKCEGKTKSWVSRQHPQHRQILEVTLKCERKAWPLHPHEHRQHRHVITIAVFFQTSSIYLIPVAGWLDDPPFNVGVKTVSRKELKRQQCGVCLFITFFIFTKSRSSCSSSGISGPSVLATIAVFRGKVCQRHHMTSQGGTLSRAGRS